MRLHSFLPLPLLHKVLQGKVELSYLLFSFIVICNISATINSTIVYHIIFDIRVIENDLYNAQGIIFPLSL